ncbi:hypothetical protein EAG_09270 [Camponotus floridanus]|uniref:Uncharacterized protein n=1 Tax=Camponotus floridanus TaxID=104421 RepID=E2B0A3_CAMFO|nr:hypothetical protein EAG_09270 [Camponotus floridanus]
MVGISLPSVKRCAFVFSATLNRKIQNNSPPSRINIEKDLEQIETYALRRGFSFWWLVMSTSSVWIVGGHACALTSPLAPSLRRQKSDIAESYPHIWLSYNGSAVSRAEFTLAPIGAERRWLSTSTKSRIKSCRLRIAAHGNTHDRVGNRICARTESLIGTLLRQTGIYSCPDSRDARSNRAYSRHLKPTEFLSLPLVHSTVGYNRRLVFQCTGRSPVHHLEDGCFRPQPTMVGRPC